MAQVPVLSGWANLLGRNEQGACHGPQARLGSDGWAGLWSLPATRLFRAMAFGPSRWGSERDILADPRRNDTAGRRRLSGPIFLTMELKEAQRQVDEWISQFEEGYWPPLVNLTRLVEEVGELARELNHLYGAKPRKDDEPDGDLALEMADVLFVLLALANEQGIDLGQALERTLEKYRERDSERWTRKVE